MYGGDERGQKRKSGAPIAGIRTSFELLDMGAGN